MFVLSEVMLCVFTILVHILAHFCTLHLVFLLSFANNKFRPLEMVVLCIMAPLTGTFCYALVQTCGTIISYPLSWGSEHTKIKSPSPLMRETRSASDVEPFDKPD